MKRIEKYRQTIHNGQQPGVYLGFPGLALYNRLLISPALFFYFLAKLQCDWNFGTQIDPIFWHLNSSCNGDPAPLGAALTPK